MKRYWVKVSVEVRDYDEVAQRILPSGIMTEFATNLTPEPDKYVGETLKEKGELLAKLLMDESER